MTKFMKNQKTSSDNASADLEVQKHTVSAPTDDVFGEIRQDGPNYRDVIGSP
jgi:hypothetical protein